MNKEYAILVRTVKRAKALFSFIYSDCGLKYTKILKMWNLRNCCFLKKIVK